MTSSTSSLKMRKTLLIVFIGSSILAVLFGLVYSLSSFSTPPMSSGHPNSKTPVIEIGGLVAGLASCLTSIVSFFGFLASFFFGWRKDKREGAASELERQRLQIELEKQKLEISRLKAEGKQ